jgi:glutathione synthase
VRVAFLLNDVLELVATQTSAMLIESAYALGFQVSVFDVHSFCWESDGGVSAFGHLLPPGKEFGDTRSFLSFVNAQAVKEIGLSDLDLVMIRTNPARDKKNDWAHTCSLHFTRQLRDAGVRVVNDPDGLSKASNKLYLANYSPVIQPRTRVTSQRDQILSWVEESTTPLVIKPLQGTRGQGVFCIGKDAANLQAIVDTVLNDGFAMVQDYIVGAENGDIRVVLLGGEILELDGEVAAIARIPAKGDFRSNLHAGGHAQKPEISDSLREAIGTLGPNLRRDGLDLVGVDFISDQLVEINVFSTGGLYGAQNFTGKNFCEHIIMTFVDSCHL